MRETHPSKGRKGQPAAIVQRSQPTPCSDSGTDLRFERARHPLPTRFERKNIGALLQVASVRRVPVDPPEDGVENTLSFREVARLE